MSQRFRNIAEAVKILTVWAICCVLIVANSNSPGDYYSYSWFRDSYMTQTGQIRLREIEVESTCTANSAGARKSALLPGKGSEGEDRYDRQGGRTCLSRDPSAQIDERPCMYEIEAAESFGLPGCIQEGGPLSHIRDTSSCIYGTNEKEEFCWSQKGMVAQRDMYCVGDSKGETFDTIDIQCTASDADGSSCNATIRLLPRPDPLEVRDSASCGFVAGRGVFCAGPNYNNYPTRTDLSGRTGLPFSGRYGHSGQSCAVSGGKVYCFGTWYSVSEYDPSSDAETHKGAVFPAGAALPGGPAWLSCAPIATGRIVCLGGFSKGGQALDQIAEYDPGTDKITIKSARLPSGRGGLSCVSSPNNTIYCFGGSRQDSSSAGTVRTYFDTILRYDVEKDTVVESAAKLPTGRMGLSCAEASNRKIYCFGGVREGERTDQIVEYDPAKDAVSVKTTKLPDSTEGLSCVPYADGKIYCFSNRIYPFLAFTPE